MKLVSIKSPSWGVLCATVGLCVVACGGESSTTLPAAAERLGAVSSALTADCGTGTRTIVGTDVVCTYASVGTFSGANGFTPPTSVSKVQVLVVGGGGGGGEGGGGAGGLVTDAAFTVVGGTALTVKVGAGGASNTAALQSGANGGAGADGEASAFGAFAAAGGGGGGGYAEAGRDGASGGGSGCDYIGAPSSGTAGQGSAGGKSNATGYGGSGGGGGAAAIGDDGGPTAAQPDSNPTIGGNGGVGLSSSISGVAKFYAGGGGGGANTNSTPSLSDGLGGNGGGGAGARDPNLNAAPDAPASSAAANTGGGGGGGECEGFGGTGGSGVVVVRYTPCTADAQCAANQWCNTGASPSACVSDLANGVTIPNVPSHTTPALTGACTAAAGAAVCSSGVCDTAGNACGYANGTGPCTTANAGVVCRSGSCSANKKCGPAANCSVDPDCTAVQFCDSTQATPVCTPKRADGAACAAARQCTSGMCNLGGTCGVVLVSDAGTSGDGGSDGGSEGGSDGGSDGGGGSSGGTSGKVGTPPSSPTSMSTDDPDAGCSVVPSRRSSGSSSGALGMLALGLAALARRKKS